jgi:hypothetical protein
MNFSVRLVVKMRGDPSFSGEEKFGGSVVAPIPAAQQREEIL